MWIIKDWMNNHCYTDKTFNSFEEARDFISEVAQAEADKKIGYDRIGTDDWEDLYNGICDDLYAIEVNEEGEEVQYA